MKTVIEMAREATLLDSRDGWNSVPDEYREAINAFAELVRAEAWAEGYKQGVDDERTSEANIGVAGVGDFKVNPARENPYRARSNT